MVCDKETGIIIGIYYAQSVNYAIDECARELGFDDAAECELELIATEVEYIGI